VIHERITMHTSVRWRRSRQFHGLRPFLDPPAEPCDSELSFAEAVIDVARLQQAQRFGPRSAERARVSVSHARPARNYPRPSPRTAHLALEGHR
jgi:hypothetical protein